MATETLSSSRSCTCDICGVSESEDVIVPDLDLVGRVNAEVEWGQTLRFTKLNEKADFEASGQPMQTYKTGSKRRRKIKNEKPVILCDCHKHVVPVVEVKKIVDRRILNRKQHLNLLSQPRCLPTQNIEVVKVRKDTKCLPPRYVQMSVPLARRILDNWKDFQQVYSPEQMTNLKKLLQKQDALTTQEANKFFKILASRRRKEKRKQGGNLRAICHRSSKAKKDIDRVVNEVLKYFIKKPSSQVKDRHYVITNEIINRVIDKKIGKHLKRSNKDVYSMTLYQIIDQISVWIDQKVDEIDTVDLDDEGDGEEDEESSCTSGSDSDATDPDEIISNDELRALLEKTKKKDETESDEEYGPTSPESERGERMTLQSKTSKKTSQVERVVSAPGPSPDGEVFSPPDEETIYPPEGEGIKETPSVEEVVKKRKKRKKHQKRTIKMMLEWDIKPAEDNKSVKTVKSTKSGKSAKSAESRSKDNERRSRKSFEKERELREKEEEQKIRATRERIKRESKEKEAKEQERNLLETIKKQNELKEQEEKRANAAKQSVNKKSVDKGSKFTDKEGKSDNAARNSGAETDETEQDEDKKSKALKKKDIGNVIKDFTKKEGKEFAKETAKMVANKVKDEIKEKAKNELQSLFTF